MARFNNTRHQVFDDIRDMSHEELENAYGIQIWVNGRVLDDTIRRVFETLGEWATYTAAQDEDDNYGGRTAGGFKSRFDDERY